MVDYKKWGAGGGWSSDNSDPLSYDDGKGDCPDCGHSMEISDISIINGVECISYTCGRCGHVDDNYIEPCD